MVSGTVKHWLLYAAVRNLFAYLEVLPWQTGRRAAQLLGRMSFRLDHSRRKANAIENLHLAFPDATAEEVRRVLRESYAHITSSILDALHLVRLVGRRPTETFMEAEGFGKLAAQGRGVGVVFVTGHVGHWEVLGASAAALGYPIWTMTRPSRNPFLREYVRGLRQKTRQRTLNRHGSLHKMIHLVREGQNVALLIDQDARKHGIFTDFFGRPASTTPAPAIVALRTGAPVAFVHARRMPGQNRFRIVLKDVVQPRMEARRKAEIHRITQRITRDLEEVVRQAPEEWLWLHRRWKTYPGKYRHARRARTNEHRQEALTGKP